MLVSFWEDLFSGAFAVSFRELTAAPRYSSLEADEFDEGSAAEEADASVTRSSWSGGRALIFIWLKSLSTKPKKSWNLREV